MPAIVQRALAAVALVALAPVFLVLAALVRLTSAGPILHPAVRARPGGQLTLYKFRSMRVDAAPGPGVTAAGDARVTPLGARLRRSKLDELPQLWNVVRGDLLLVGPRPEDPRFIDADDPVHRRVFGARPGITGAAAIAFRDEEDRLAAAAARRAASDGRRAPTTVDVDRAYREEILPAKLAIELDYLEHRSTRTDLILLARTIGQVLRRTTPR